MIVRIFSGVSSTFFNKAEPCCLPLFHPAFPVLCFPAGNLDSFLSSSTVNAAFFYIVNSGTLLDR